jgi:hypothetical protein
LLIANCNKEHGVERVHYLQQGPLETDLKSLIYICRPQLHYMKYIAGIDLQFCINKKKKNLFFWIYFWLFFYQYVLEHISHHQNDNSSSNYEYNLFFVPRRTMICERVLEEAGVFGDILILNQIHILCLIYLITFRLY